MQITKIVNNNIVISEDKNHKEVVLMGKGLGFQKHKGDEIKLSQIEKTYVMKDHGMTQRFQEMLTDIPIERVKICNKIIQYAKDTLQKNINDNIYVSLTDHINFAIEDVYKRQILKYMNIQEHAKQRSPIRQLEKLRQLKQERQKML